MSAWPRASTSIYFLPSPAPIADGPGRGQHPGSRAGPLVTAAQVDVTDASLMAIISPSHFTWPLPQLQISRECLFNRWLIAFYYAATAACVELPSPLCCESGGRVPLLVGSQLCKRTAVAAVAQAPWSMPEDSVCPPGFYFGGLLGLSITGMKFGAIRKMGHWLCLHPALCPQMSCHPLIWHSPSSATLNSPL